VENSALTLGDLGGELDTKDAADAGETARDETWLPSRERREDGSPVFRKLDAGRGVASLDSLSAFGATSGVGRLDLSTLSFGKVLAVSVLRRASTFDFLMGSAFDGGGGRS